MAEQNKRDGGRAVRDLRVALADVGGRLLQETAGSTVLS